MNNSSCNSILVIGASGNLGQKAVSRFQLDGYTVRALVRNPHKVLFPKGIEVRKGDLLDVPSIKAAMEGMDYVHISVNAGNDPNEIKEVEEKGIMKAIDIAGEMGIKKITWISGMNANPGNLHTPPERAKVTVEKYFQEGKVNFTIFKPGFFAETLARFIQGKRAMMLGRQPHKMQIMIMDDLMRNLSKSFRMPETDRSIYYIHGAEAPLLLNEALKRYTNLMHPGMKTIVMPIGVMRLINRLFLRGNLTRTLDTMSILKKKGEEGDSTEYYSVFGRDHTKFQDWLRQQKGVVQDGSEQ